MKRCIKKLAPVFAACIVLLVSLPAGILADETPTVNLELSGSGATPWNIGNIRPGEGGVKTVTLHNSGSSDGRVSIWISDILDKEGANPEPETGNTAEPGELGKYLAFNMSADGLRSDVDFPTNIYNFPRSASDARSIRIDPLKSGGPIVLNWEWRLPPETGNDVQGDSLSFTINYLLESFATLKDDGGGGGSSGGSGGGTTQPLEIVSRDSGARIRVHVDGAVAENQTVALIENKVIIILEKGTQVLLGSAQLSGDGAPIPGVPGRVPARLEVEVAKQAPEPPTGMMIIGPVYDLFALGETGRESVTFSSPLKLVLNYDAEALPGNVLSVFLAYFDEKERKWVKLESPRGFIAGVGQAVAEVNHFTLFAVLVELAQAPVPPVPKPPPAPARFQLRNMDISPGTVKVGENITVKSQLVNIGEQVGDYVLAVTVPGLLETGKVIRLAPGESREVAFMVTPRSPGTYQVRIGDLLGSFVVEGVPVPPLPTTPAPLAPEAQPGVYTWLTILILAVLALAVIAALLLALVRRVR